MKAILSESLSLAYSKSPASAQFMCHAWNKPYFLEQCTV